MSNERPDVCELFGLVLDRVDDPAVTVARVDAHQLAVEVDEATSVDRGEVDAPAAGDGHRLEPRLGAPVVQRVPDAELGDLFRREGLDGLLRSDEVLLRWAFRMGRRGMG